MEERTRDVLAIVHENREFARFLLADGVTTDVARRWAVVIAFYSAVHYANAYLWERLRMEPANHEERISSVVTLADLRPVSDHYQRLQFAGFNARYRRRYRVTHEVAEARVHGDLDAVRAAVVNALQP